jgi:hypothetical protein
MLQDAFMSALETHRAGFFCDYGHGRPLLILSMLGSALLFSANAHLATHVLQTLHFWQ